MKWFWIHDHGETMKSHAVPEPLKDKVFENLYLRGAKNLQCVDFDDFEAEEGERKCLSLDLPGMVMMDRHIFTIELSDLAIQMPAVDIEEILYRVENAPERKEFGEPYYKLHCYLRCLCMTEPIREELVAKLKAIRAEANAIRDVENRIFNERFENARNHHVLVQERPTTNKPPSLN